MPKIEDDTGIDKPDVTTHSVTAVSPTDSDIILVGTCPPETNKLWISVDNADYKESVSSALARSLGIISGDCTNGVFSLSYPVPDPTVSKEITFLIRAANSEGRMGAIETYLVSYNKPPVSVPGFAIVSVGGLAGSNTGNYFLTSGGQTVSPILDAAAPIGLTIGATPANALVRPGLIGVLLEL